MLARFNSFALKRLRALSITAAFTGISLALSGGSFVSAHSQSSTPRATAIAPAPLPAAADASRFVTEFDVSGLKVIVKQRKGSQTVVAGLFLRGGALNITAANAGIEALMLDVATEASANFPRERLRRELSRIGTSLSYGINYDYSVLTLGSTRQHFDRSWEIFTDAALRPSFAPDDFARVKNRLVISRGDDEDTPDSHLQVLQSKLAYTGHPYLNDPRGTAESVSKLTVDDVRKFHQQMMQTSRLLLVVVGNIEPEQFRRNVEASLGKLPRGNYKPSPVPSLSFDAQSVEITPRNLPTNYVQGVFVAPALPAADFYPMQIASTILQNRVFVEIRSKRNLSYAPDAFLRDQAANIGGIYVTSTDANQSVALMLGEINRLQSDLVSSEDLMGVVQHYLTRYYLGQETNAAQAGELAKYELVGGGWRNSGLFMDRLRAVTPSDVKRVAETYMRNIRFVVLGNPQSIDRRVFGTREGD